MCFHKIAWSGFLFPCGNLKKYEAARTDTYDWRDDWIQNFDDVSIVCVHSFSKLLLYSEMEYLWTEINFPKHRRCLPSSKQIVRRHHKKFKMRFTVHFDAICHKQKVEGFGMGKSKNDKPNVESLDFTCAHTSNVKWLELGIFLLLFRT